MISAPCKDCSDRELGCHDKCIKYKKYTIDNNKEKERIRDIKSKENIHRDFVLEQKEKRRRARRYGC